MNLVFNIYLELAALPLDIILCVYFWHKYRDNTRINREFRLLSVLVTLGTLVDVMDAVIIGFGDQIPGGIRFLHNTLDYAVATIAAYQFVRYVTAYVGMEFRNSVAAIINKTIFAIYVVILIQNFFTGNVFTYTGTTGGYTGPLYTMIVYVYPLYYILFGGVFILSHTKTYTRGMKLSLLIAFIFMVILYAIQMFIDRHLLVTFFAASIGLFIMFLTLETPDYAKLTRTLEELSISRRELEATGIRATEMSRAKSRFLAQMSNEIRTPVNAIMGYSNLILADTKEESTREYSQRVKISAKRLLVFFENVLNFVSEESEDNSSRRLPSLAELIEQTDEEIYLNDSDGAHQKALGGASDVRILVVDDAELNIDLMVRMLRPIGFTVDTANNGKQAILQVRKFHYDLIFMDHLMPVMDGTEALKQLRSEKLCEDTPVIMLTANAITGEEEKYLNLGFAAYITKPFTEEAILEILRKFLPITDSQWKGEVGISAWEDLQEKLPTVRVADAREYFLHDIDFYKELLRAFANNGIGTELSAAIRKGDYTLCLAMIRSQHDCAKFIGAETLVKITERLEVLLKKGEYELLRERAGAFIAEKNILGEQIEDI